MMARRAGRQRNQLPTCYFEGYLEKRSFKDKTSRRLWTCLCGNILFFFNDKRENDYIEKLDLSELLSITDDNSQDRNLDAARLNLQMKDGNVKFTVPNAEARELWKGYIHSVTELSVPPSLNLLPGQVHMLKEVVEKEKERIKDLPPPAADANSSPYVSLIADMPACYHVSTRLEAEMLLEREAKRGNLLLRPGRGGNNFAVTTRQDLDRPVFRHYRVTRKPEGGFIIDVDNPVPCATLHDIINYLVEKTDGVLIPLIMEEQYESNISFICKDKENGEKHVQQAVANTPSPPPKPAFIRTEAANAEKSVQQATSNLVPPSLPPKPDCIRPDSDSGEKSGQQTLSNPPVPPSLSTKPAVLRTLTPEPEPEMSEEEPIYLNDAELERNPPKKAIMPPAVTPTPLPRKFASSVSSNPSSTSTSSTSSSASSTNWNLRMRSNSDIPRQIPPAALSELKLKLEQKAKCLE